MNRFDLNNDGSIRRGDFRDVWTWAACIRYWLNLGWFLLWVRWGTAKLTAVKAEAGAVVALS